VVKDDGLAAGKGVVVTDSRETALAHGTVCLANENGRVVVEEYLDGPEVSLFCVADGATVVPLVPAQDFKRVGNDDEGPNTGGMGAYSPAPVMTPAMEQRVMAEIINPTLSAMAARGTPFKGVLFAGLMITADGPKLIEYNVRFGDPETQVLMSRLRSDILPALIASADGVLAATTLRWREEAALCVVLVTQGYPGAVKVGSEIRGLAQTGSMENVVVFHAATRRNGDRILSNGGRVLGVTAIGKSIREAQARAYEAVATVDWPEGYCRRDIGWRALARDEARTQDA
jgi:phosphoribosylamine---glycine ligase